MDKRICGKWRQQQDSDTLADNSIVIISPNLEKSRPWHKLVNHCRHVHVGCNMTMTPLQWDKSRARKRKTPKNEKTTRKQNPVTRWKPMDDAEMPQLPAMQPVPTTMPRIQLKRQEVTIRLAHDSHFFFFPLFLLIVQCTPSLIFFFLRGERAAASAWRSPHLPRSP
ncbi:uncharacterized protein TrAtP1_008430 [Trichoderma atroviride]|uniref:uncharacterized protein n=1 Tax=Hypocrea atroviridis TaxID=63577 RepID=UPI0033342B14|nr:hypothetical protein TrAtP1_008430 [Trichoderma atroviride]